MGTASAKKPKAQPVKCKLDCEAIYDIIKKIKQSHRAVDKKLKDMVNSCATKTKD